jgi:hypothetical protein
MDKRLRLLLRQASYNLRGGFLVRPSALALSLGVPALSDIVPDIVPL